MILLDTGPLVGLCHPADAHHSVARRQLQDLAAQDLVTCEAVLVEAWFHLTRNIQRKRLDALLDAKDVVVVPTASDRGFRDEVFSWLLKYADHAPDWADGCIAVLSGRDHDLDVWTYDSEFRTVWRRQDGTRIPLAV